MPHINNKEINVVYKRFTVLRVRSNIQARLNHKYYVPTGAVAYGVNEL